MKLFVVSQLLANTLVPPRTPRFGARTAANLTVHVQYADGEIGFQETRVTVTEPENGRAKQINLVVFRDGTLFRASLLWNIVGVKSSADLNPTNGNLVFEKGTVHMRFTCGNITRGCSNFTCDLHVVILHVVVRSSHVNHIFLLCHYFLGQSSVNITIEILPDTTPELDESFTIQLHNVSESNQKLQSGSVSEFIEL